jgi:hypothetical protein
MLRLDMLATCLKTMRHRCTEAYLIAAQASIDAALQIY